MSLLIGIVLISPNKVCSACSGKLLIRSDRPSRVTVYTECDGTVIGSHFQKFCQNYRKGCRFNQYYGCHTFGDKSLSHYDSNWNELPYLVSTSQTVFF